MNDDNNLTFSWRDWVFGLPAPLHVCRSVPKNFCLVELSISVDILLGLFVCHLWFCLSRGAERTKVHVCLPYRGAVSFYVCIVPLGLISVFLCVGRVQIFCGLLPARFCLNFPVKVLLSKTVKFQIHF